MKTKLLKSTLLATLFAGATMYGETAVWSESSYTVGGSSSVIESFDEASNWENGTVPSDSIDGNIAIKIDNNSGEAFTYTVQLTSGTSSSVYSYSLNDLTLALDSESTGDNTLTLSGTYVNLTVDGTLSADAILLTNSTVSADVIIANTLSTDGGMASKYIKNAELDLGTVVAANWAGTFFQDCTNYGSGNGIDTLIFGGTLSTAKHTVTLYDGTSLSIGVVDMSIVTATLSINNWTDGCVNEVGYFTGSDASDTISMSSSNAALRLTGDGEFNGVVSASGTDSYIYFSGNQTFTGTTSVSGTINYVIENGGKLTVNDASGVDITVQSGGTLAVGDTSLAANSLTLSDGSIIEIALEQLIAEYILFDMTFNSESSGTVELSFVGDLDVNTEYSIALFDEDTDIGTILFESDSFDTYFYDSETGVLTFTSVPEPSTYAMIFGTLALGLAVYRRRK